MSIKAKPIISVFCLLLLACSCAVNKGIPGQYMAPGKYEFRLTLRKDSSFTMYEQGWEAMKWGKGSWKIDKQDSLLLRFQDFDRLVSQNHQKGDSLKFFIMKNGKLRLHTITLKRVKDNLIE